MKSNLRKALLWREDSERKWIYIVCGIPFLLFAIAGLEYGAFSLYIIFFILCILQFFYPTFIGRSIITIIYAVGCGIYSFGLLRDVVLLFLGERPQILLGKNDSIFFGLLLAFLILTLFFLFKVKPKKGKNQS